MLYGCMTRYLGLFCTPYASSGGVPSSCFTFVWKPVSDSEHHHRERSTSRTAAVVARSDHRQSVIDYEAWKAFYRGALLLIDLNSAKWFIVRNQIDAGSHIAKRNSLYRANPTCVCNKSMNEIVQRSPGQWETVECSTKEAASVTQVEVCTIYTLQQWSTYSSNEVAFKCQ